MKRLLPLLCAFLLFCPAQARAERILYIKYRSTPVDVDKPYFEELDTSKSSFIGGAWYDASKSYMVIDLSGTNYHYCGLDKHTWTTFKASESFGSNYNSMIKGNFDCRINPVPEYPR